MRRMLFRQLRQRTMAQLHMPEGGPGVGRRARNDTLTIVQRGDAAVRGRLFQFGGDLVQPHRSLIS